MSRTKTKEYRHLIDKILRTDNVDRVVNGTDILTDLLDEEVNVDSDASSDTELIEEEELPATEVDHEVDDIEDAVDAIEEELELKRLRTTDTPSPPLIMSQATEEEEEEYGEDVKEAIDKLKDNPTLMMLVRRDLDIALLNGTPEDKMFEVIPHTGRSLRILKNAKNYFHHDLQAWDRVKLKTKNKDGVGYGILYAKKDDNKWKVKPVFYDTNDDGEQFLAWTRASNVYVDVAESNLKRLSPLDPVAFEYPEDGLLDEDD